MSLCTGEIPMNFVDTPVNFRWNSPTHKSLSLAKFVRATTIHLRCSHDCPRHTQPYIDVLHVIFTDKSWSIKVPSFLSDTWCIREVALMFADTRCIDKVSLISVDTRCIEEIRLIYSDTRCLLASWKVSSIVKWVNCNIYKTHPGSELHLRGELVLPTPNQC